MRPLAIFYKSSLMFVVKNIPEGYDPITILEYYAKWSDCSMEFLSYAFGDELDFETIKNCVTQTEN